MDSKHLNLNDVLASVVDAKRTPAQLTPMDIFAEGSYLNEFTLFLAHFNTVPNFIYEVKIDCKKAGKWFVETYKKDIKDLHFGKRYFKRSKTAEYDDIFIILYDDLIVYLNTNCSTVRLLFRKTDINKVEEIATGMRRFKERKEKCRPEIYLLVNTFVGIETRALQILKPKLNIKDNYNDDFEAIHEIIYKRLSKKNDKGLVLLHGKPGTGKTSYIRYLISLLKKNVIFLPPNMAKEITSPQLISILIQNPDSVFVIEDAENIVVDREKDGQSPVSALLNISDGLLSDCLNIQVICSFNTDISKIDSALMRKGRLIAKYEFKDLGPEKAQALSRKLGYDKNIAAPMALTAIYNQDENDYSQNRKNNSIGFMASINNNN